MMANMASAKEVAKRKFDRWASSYERDRRSRFNARPQQEALAALSLRPGDHFLDVGCGTGAAVRQAASTAERAVGLDISERMIARAKELAADVPGSDFVVGDSERLPFPDAAFTAILCTASFHHYPDPVRALSEMARVLTADGRLVIADGTADLRVVRIVDWFLRRFDQSHVRLYRTSEMVAFLSQSGFADPTVRYLFDGGYAILRARRTAAR
jgi:ubiquinone/menaquinone biosynthesis C-methylase UbiE